MSIIDRPRPRLSLVTGRWGGISTALSGCRAKRSRTACARISTMLEEASGTKVLDWSLEVEEGNLAQLRYVLAAAEGHAIAVPDEAALDAQLQAMLRGWGDAVEAELANTEEPARAAAIATRYADAFPESYRVLYGASEAAIDIAHLRRIASGGDEHPRAVRLYRLPASDEPTRLRLKIYERNASLVLSDVVPALENFGFRVIDNIPTTLGSDERLG
jgi:glutamate dehydrogenase